jgi:hypothetical protein
VVLYGVALATLDDDPGVRPDAHAFIIDKATWFIVTDDLPQYPARIFGPKRSLQFQTGRLPRLPDSPGRRARQRSQTSMKIAPELSARSRFSQRTFREGARCAGSGPMQRHTAALPVQPDSEIACKTSLKMPDCTCCARGL